MNKKYAYLAWITIIGFLIFRIIYIAVTEYNLTEDEAYFWDWSRHPAMSYYDMGPMIAWIIRFFTLLLPLSEFSVRIGTPLLIAMTGAVIYLLAADITRSSLLGFITVLLFHITPINTAGGIIITYYSPQVFFMAITALFLWQLVKSNDSRWWYLIGLSLGLGLLSHHMFILFSAEVALFVLLSGNRRKWLTSRELYFGVIIGILVASPVIIWNMTHGYVMIRHAVGLMSTWSDIIKTFGEYLGGQAGVQTPLFFLAVVYAISISGYRGIRLRDEKHLLLFSLSAPIIIFIALLSAGGRTEANWPVSGYITGGISAVWVLSEKYELGSRIKRISITAAGIFTLLFGIAALGIAYFPSTVHKITGISLPPRLDPANRLYGWRELGEEVSAVRKVMPGEAFIATNGYGLNAELAFYVEGNPEVYEIPVKRRFSQYDFWNDAINVVGKDAVFTSRRPMTEGIKALFDRIELAKHLVIRTETGNEVRKQFYIYRCYNYKGTSGQVSSY
ncbi:MAG: glycosyltransferase family 39 protein [Fidelibacterota bacterium]|nr:MAG: glycosyltransferase family 39 protein [Candidatus Neomarinimicrobiota bacterium]